MTSKVEIYNLALMRIGKDSQVQTPDEDSAEAAACTAAYNIVREFSLRDFPWNFASGYIDLALTTITNSEWLYVYQYPNDCIMAWYIVPVLNQSNRYLNEKIPFTIFSDSNGRYIGTNQEDAKLFFSRDVTNTTFFDSQFVDSISWLLASHIAVPLTRDVGIANSMKDSYQRSLSLAKSSQHYEERPKLPPESEFTSVKYD